MSAEGWRNRKLKTLARLLTEKASSELRKIGLENLEGWTGRLLSDGGQFDGEGVQFCEGDILFGKLRPYLAKAWVADDRGAAVGDFLVIRPGRDVDVRFLSRWLLSPSTIELISSSVYGARMPRASWNYVRELEICLPDIPAQIAIADYADRETTEIDSFIADQEELIALLAERRAATISRIVTKGLDSMVEMRESGVGWLGDVPIHWQAGNIRRFATMKTGHTPSRSKEEYWVDCAVPWFTLADVWQLRQGRTYLGKTSAKISLLGLQNSAAELLPAGTVVLSRTASVGFSGIMPQPMATSQDYWNWICKSSLLPKYLWYQFLAMRPFFGSLVHGSTHKTIYQADAAALGIAAPPVDEQELIIGYLDRETAELDAAIADAREAIALSKERRAALISAAVTGKIDVRGAA